MRIEIKKRYIFEVEQVEDNLFKVIGITPLEFVCIIRAINIKEVRKMLKKIIGGMDR